METLHSSVLEADQKTFLGSASKIPQSESPFQPSLGDNQRLTPHSPRVWSGVTLVMSGRQHNLLSCRRAQAKGMNS